MCSGWIHKVQWFSFEYVGFWPKIFLFRTQPVYFAKSKYSLISTYHAYNLRVDGFCEDASTGRDVIYNFVKSRPLNFFAFKRVHHMFFTNYESTNFFSQNFMFHFLEGCKVTLPRNELLCQLFGGHR